MTDRPEEHAAQRAAETLLEGHPDVQRYERVVPFTGKDTGAAVYRLTLSDNQRFELEVKVARG